MQREGVRRWSVFENITQEIFGADGDGTSIDLEEPFVIRFKLTFIFFYFLFLKDLAVMEMAGC